MEPIILESHYGIHVLRDDLLEGGTKSILLNGLEHAPHTEFVYASPVYGGFQIALSAYCKKHQLKATIFCARRTKKHANTMSCIQYGAKVVEVYPGYLTVVEKRAREYCQDNPHAHKIVFGANTPDNIATISIRAQRVLQSLAKEPDEIWVAVGSGTLIKGISRVVHTAKIYGVIVGAKCEYTHPNVTYITYPKPFEYESKLQLDFPSMANYDRKAFELCLLHNTTNTTNKSILFWNVL